MLEAHPIFSSVNFLFCLINSIQATYSSFFTNILSSSTITLSIFFPANTTFLFFFTFLFQQTHFRFRISISSIRILFCSSPSLSILLIHSAYRSSPLFSLLLNWWEGDLHDGDLVARVPCKACAWFIHPNQSILGLTKLSLFSLRFNIASSIWSRKSSGTTNTEISAISAIWKL